MHRPPNRSRLHRPRLLLYSMYPLDQGRWGPTVRIAHLRDELAKLADLDVVAGYRGARRVAAARYALAGGLRALDGIYVENSSTLPSETDIAFLALARAMGVPVLTYIRDAQYLFEEYYAADTFRRRMARRLFPLAIRLLRRVSTQAAYPSLGLARAVGDDSAQPLLLPPGSPAPLDVPPAPDANRLLFVGGMRYPAHGLDLLVRAIERVRAAGHDVGVTCVSRPGEEPPEPRPEWLSVERGSADEIRRLLPGVIATIQPRRCTPYNNLAVPIKILEYLSYGRPLIVTDCLEQARIVREAGCGLVAADDADALADAVSSLLRADASQRRAWAGRALQAASENSWAVRASVIVDRLSALHG